MKAYLITTGTVFGLIVVRMSGVSSRKVRNSPRTRGL